MSDRSLRWARTTGADQVRSGDDYPELVAAALRGRDWYAAYMWSKSWTSHGGALSPDPWLGHALSSLVHGQSRGAIHALDIGLARWVEPAQDRAVLRFARGAVLMLRLDDPKTALADLEAACQDAPAWLAPVTAWLLSTCRESAADSRKRKPSVDPAPRLDPADHDILAEPPDSPLDGKRPHLWTMLCQELEIDPG